MNSKRFKTRTLIETLTLICLAKGGDYLRAGKPNQSEIGRQAGTSQTNVSRWFAGSSKPTDENINRLAKAFRISPAQMRGELPIDLLDGVSPQSAEDEEFMNAYLHLPEELKEQIRAQTLLYKKLNDSKNNQN
ncbi:helix-turn-helix domain-containing protein [Cellvibrio mixtus]|uniref:helix-turn-helix domain-containing protein n=1 Tax=Cellvibrio mixtus TaxID=39650 RepID=UPI000586F940|nr:helix-turn-helix domain-containing protein [Cellvibrio mixtus]